MFSWIGFFGNYEELQTPGTSRQRGWGGLLQGPPADVFPKMSLHIMFLGPSIFFFLVFGSSMSSSLFLLSLLFYLTTIGSYLYVSLCDPGFFPACTDGDLRYLLRQQGIQIRDRDPLPLEVMMRPGIINDPVLHHLCPICNIYCPPRTLHCMDCDVCCEGFDHHCPFVGNCIGERNRTMFGGFLVSFFCFLLTMLWTVVVQSPFSWVTFLVGTYATAMLVGVGGFTTYHILLYLNGMTTREHLQCRV